jgi:hypothetical protein
VTSDPVAVQRAAEAARSRKPAVHTWQGTDPARLESVRVLVNETRFRASGRLIAVADPQVGSEPYSVSFEAGFDSVAKEGHVLLRTTTAEDERQVAINRSEEGVWLVDRGEDSERANFDGAVVVDVVGGVTFTSLAVRHLDLHRIAGEHEIPVVSVSLPDLATTLVRHTYRTVELHDEGATIELTRGGATLTLRVDRDGVVVDFPGVVTKL